MCNHSPHDHRHRTDHDHRRSRGGPRDRPPASTGGRPVVATLTRRSALAAGAGAVALSVAGCLDGSGETPDPVAITGTMECDVCGMVVANHPGPNGQIFFRDNAPENHEPPARFDALKQCLFPYLLERQEMDWEPTAIFVTDYSAVEYTVSSEGDTTVISSHTEPESFADAREMHFVVGSDVEGAMGPDFVPFSNRDDAESFAGEHDGSVRTYDEIDEGVIGR